MKTKVSVLNCFANKRSRSMFDRDNCPNPPVGRDANEILACVDHNPLDKVCVMDAFVDWSEEYDSPGTLTVMLNRHPDESKRVYEKRGPLYYSANEGLVRFFSYTKPGDGYGGRRFKVRLTDGSEETLIGPWSSGETAMIAAGFPPCVSASICYLEDSVMGKGVDVFAKGHTFYGGSISLELAIQACKRAPINGVSLMWHEGRLIPVKTGLNRGSVIGLPPPIQTTISFNELSDDQMAIVRHGL